MNLGRLSWVEDLSCLIMNTIIWMNQATPVLWMLRILLLGIVLVLATSLVGCVVYLSHAAQR